MLNEGQSYIAYSKGGLVFYALKDYLGEETVNKVLKEYIHDVAFQKAPFTNSIELVQRFKKATPDDKKYLIEDFFETITFYCNRTESVKYTNSKGKYNVEIKMENKKFRENGLGSEVEIDMNDCIDVGIFDKDDNIIYLEKHKIKNGMNVLNIIVDKVPYTAGVDPFNKLLDKKLDEHIKKALELK